MTLLESTFTLVKEMVKSKNYSVASLESLYECLRVFREKIKTSKFSIDSEMLGQVNTILNSIQKKEIEDCCLEGLPSIRRNELYRFVLEDHDGSKLVKYFALANLDSL